MTVRTCSNLHNINESRQITCITPRLNYFITVPKDYD